MGGEWLETTLGAFCPFTYGKSLPAPKRDSNGGVPVYGSGGLSGYHNEAFVRQRGIIVGRKGTVGSITYCDQPFWPIDTTFFITEKKNQDLLFTYYLLQTLRLDEMNADSAVPGLNRDAAHSVQFKLPPLTEQKSIAHILGSLDNKIELSRQINATLESMAQALFKSWFVDFDPVIDNALAAGNPVPEPLHERAETRKVLGDKRKPLPKEIQKQFPSRFVFSEVMGWIPEGWKAVKLSDLLEVKYGKDHKKLSDGVIPVYGSGGLMRNADKALYKGESVLIPRKGTLSNILYLNEEFWTVDTMFYTVPKSKFVPKYAFYHLKGLDFASMNVGSAVPSMTTKVLNELPVLAPTVFVLESFDSFLTTYFNKREINNTQSKGVSKLRDTLLPKLLSGQLRIPDAEKLVAEVE